MIRHAACIVLLACLVTSASAAQDRGTAPPLDWSVWEHLPALHHGRVMPVDTFSEKAVKVVCGTTHPKLGLEGVVPAKELKSSDFDEARKLFKVAKTRKFSPAELLFSWMVQPEQWEEVPFLVAKDPVLREKYLGLPLVNEKGEALKYVSPRQFLEASAFHARREELQNLQRQAKMRDAEFEIAGVDKKIAELQEAYEFYRQLTFNPTRVVTWPAAQGLRMGSRFLMKFAEADQEWQRLARRLQSIGLQDGNSPLSKWLTDLDRSAQTLDASVRLADLSLEQAEAVVLQFQSAADGLAEHMTNARQSFDKQAPKQVSKEKQRTWKIELLKLTSQTRSLAKRAHEMHLALYETTDALRLVPALNPDALETDRTQQDDAQPWLSIQALLYGSPDLLDAYPQKSLLRSRKAIFAMAQSYLDWQQSPTPGHATDFLAHTRSVARGLQDLGSAIEPLREQLVLQKPDKGLMAYTSYPPAGSTDVEVLYNRLDPFKWSWIISLTGLLLFSLAFGALRKPVFWLGMLTVVLGLTWTAYAFSLRIRVTHWAPVTNMYETVVYVPFVVSALGVWFALLPLTWSGLRNAWRMNALPGTWEAKPLTAEQTRLMSPSSWTLASVATLLPRAALMAGVFYILSLAPYAAGDRAVINLLPSVDMDQSTPDLSSVMAWAVGWCVLALSVWFLPRVVLTAVTGLAIVPLSLRQSTGAQVAQVYPRRLFVAASTFVSTILWLLAWYSPVLDESFSPLQPVLRDNFWLTIHVLTIVSSYGAGALAWGLGNLALAYYLFGKYREPAQAASSLSKFRSAPAASINRQRNRGAEAAPMLGSESIVNTTDDLQREPVDDAEVGARRPPEVCAHLAGYTYKVIQVAVLLLITGTILGGLWADVSWGRFWGWDPKEVWALISGLVYLAILHGRYAGWFGNFGLAAGAVLGATAITMSWYGVNFVLGAGLHAYAFGEGGQLWVGLGVLCNWVFLGVASARYLQQTLVKPLPEQIVMAEQLEQRSVKEAVVN